MTQQCGRNCKISCSGDTLPSSKHPLCGLKGLNGSSSLLFMKKPRLMHSASTHSTCTRHWMGFRWLKMSTRQGAHEELPAGRRYEATDKCFRRKAGGGLPKHGPFPTTAACVAGAGFCVGLHPQPTPGHGHLSQGTLPSCQQSCSPGAHTGSHLDARDANPRLQDPGR